MPLWNKAERVAISFGLNRLRILVARDNGHRRPVFEAAVELPEGAMRAGLRAPSIAEPDEVRAALEGLIEQAGEQGRLRRRPELVALLIQDAAVKVATSPIDGPVPSRDEADKMARWMLRELLPVEAEEARIDWAVLGADSATKEESERWMLAVGAERALIEEYEELVGSVDWSVGRVLPWTLGLASGAALELSGERRSEAESGDRLAGLMGWLRGRGAAADSGEAPESDEAVASLADRKLIICEADGTLACLFDADGIPRFHRAWRARVPPDRLAAELATLQRYIADRLESTIQDAWICGPSDGWNEQAAAACRELGLGRVRSFSPAVALLGGLAG